MNARVVAVTEDLGTGMKRWYRVDEGVVSESHIGRYLRGQIQARSVVNRD